MQTKQKSLKLLLLCLALGSLVLVLLWLYPWLKNQIEWREKIISEAPSLEVLQNPYLAAKFFLKKQGLQVKTQTGALMNLKNLPPASSLLMMGQNNWFESNTSQKIWQWVQEGGQLILEPPPAETVPGFLEKLNLSFIKADPEEISKIKKHHPNSDQKKGCQAKKNDYLESPALAPGEKLKLALNPEKLLYQENSLKEAGLPWLRVSYGQGEVLLLTRTAIWRNEEIACLDHAYFLKKILKKTQAVSILYEVDSPGLLSLLIRHSPMVLFSLGLLFLAWLLSLSPYHGPRRQKPQEARLNFNQHLEASGDFFSRHQVEAYFLDDFKKELKQKILKKFPRLKKESQESWASSLQVPNAELDKIFNKNKKTNDFFEEIKSLQNLEKKI